MVQSLQGLQCIPDKLKLIPKPVNNARAPPATWILLSGLTRRATQVLRKIKDAMSLSPVGMGNNLYRRCGYTEQAKEM